jgi:hypothetical protein
MEFMVAYRIVLLFYPVYDIPLPIHSAMALK